MFHKDEVEGSMAHGSQCFSLPTGQGCSNDDMSLEDEDFDSIGVSEYPSSHGASGPSINRRSKSIEKKKGKSRPRLKLKSKPEFDMIKDPFNRSKVVEKGMGSQGSSDAKLEACIGIQNGISLDGDVYSEAIQLSIENTKACTTSLAMKEEGRLLLREKFNNLYFIWDSEQRLKFLGLSLLAF